MTISMPKCQCFGSQPVLPYGTVEPSREKEGLSRCLSKSNVRRSKTRGCPSIQHVNAKTKLLFVLHVGMLCYKNGQTIDWPVLGGHDLCVSEREWPWRSSVCTKNSKSWLEMSAKQPVSNRDSRHDCPQKSIATITPEAFRPVLG